MATRGGFSGKLGFVAAAAGSAVGLGNIWQFPYITGQNGGAAFLIVYVLWIFFIGLPIMVGEIAVGRSTQSNPYGAYKKLGGRSWSIVGLFGILCGVMILSFYNVVAGWAFGYFLQITFGNLFQQPDYATYFYSYVADFSDNLFYSLAFMVLTGFIVYHGIQKGIETTSKILMPTLFLILLLIIGYGFTLPNAFDGVEFYLFPDFQLINGATIYTALGQAFFSLSLGMGALITYGSYIHKSDNIINSAVLVTVADTMVAFLAGLMIFPLVFSQGQSPSEGPGLVFIALIGVFESMGPVVGKFIGGSFFLLLCFAALTSTISLLEVPVSYFVDEKKWDRRKAVFLVAFLIFILGLPSMLAYGALDFFSEFAFYEGTAKTFMDVVQDIFFVVGLPLGGFLLSLFISRHWKTLNLTVELSHGNHTYPGSWLEKYFNFMITYICPVVLGIMFLITLLQKFFGLSIF